MMDKVGKAFRFLKNDYIRAAAGGVIVVLMTLAVGSQTYNGAGANIIEMCFENRPSEIFALAFLLKMIFTAVTLGSGYKGGEIVPSLFIGATLGVKFGALIGFSPSLCAALGMCALFCGVTNCPVASLLICFEMFGFDAMPFFLLAVSFTYLFSGNFGLYHGQVIRYSKYEPGKVNAHTHH
jgi:H+/Cl- antiporter ClcA